MYIQRITTKQNGKSYTSICLCRSYREDGKQKREILATMTKWPKHVVDGIEKSLKNQPVTTLKDLEQKQGKSIGAIWMLFDLAKQIGLTKAFGQGKQGKLALLQVLARCIDPSSRLHIANFWPDHYALEETLKIQEPFDEDDLYENLDWLCDNQQSIEKKLFRQQHGDSEVSEIYLYDVTSSYFEGQQNELADYGYNRDGKRGKKQIVIGLLSNKDGDPISVEVFEGNTSDLSTFSSQLKKLKDQFGIKTVVIVGDKGMIKSKQIDEVTQLEWNYITSITKAQIQKLLKQDIFQMELFESEPVEVQDGQMRYILRRNPERATQMKDNRLSKILKIRQHLDQQNQYLKDHPRAQVLTAQKKIETQIAKLKLSKALSIQTEKRTLSLITNEAALQELHLLDGCYVIKTELAKKQATTQQIHDRYKDLAKVEHAFRTMKTGLEEIRPIYVTKESRTRGHVFVCMLAYKIIHRLRTILEVFDQLPTIKDIIKSMDAIHYSEYKLDGQVIKIIPSTFNSIQEKIIALLKIKFPTAMYAK